jgi:alpha-N-arabinofuranosidase
MYRYLPISLFLCACLTIPRTSFAADSTARIVIHVDQGQHQISRHIYGHFAEHLGRCIYDGLWVGKDSKVPNTDGVRSDVIAALKELAIPNLRWPGGCFADSYQWRDGIGPSENRPQRTNVWWGNAPESNAFGTHEFLDLCERLGCQPIIAGNVGSGTPAELADWVEYVNSEHGSLADERRANGREKPWGVRFWGIGNESWGCGGNMRPEYYADLMLRYTTFVRPHGRTHPFSIASGASDADYNWTEVLMKAYARKSIFDGLSLHHYTLPTGNWSKKGSATQFEENQWASTIRNTLEMDELIKRHSEIMDRFDAKKRVSLAVDEWGTWYDPPESGEVSALYQQNSLRDALVVGINLNIFNNHCQRVRMANIAQTVNVLQAMVLTRGPEMVLTPSYYAFRMFRPHQDATMLPVELSSPQYVFGDVSIPALTASASHNDKGVIHLSLTNADPRQAISTACQLEGLDPEHGKKWKVSGELLTANRMNAFNDFGKEPEVHPVEMTGLQIVDGVLSLNLPAKSVVVLRIENVAAN